MYAVVRMGPVEVRDGLWAGVGVGREWGGAGWVGAGTCITSVNNVGWDI